MMEQEFDSNKAILERVLLVKNSLLSAHYQVRWNVVGLRQIINRFFMLLQMRCIITIVERIKIGREEKYRIIHHTCLDSFWKDDFEQVLKDNFSDKYDDNEDIIVIDTNKKFKSLDGQEENIDGFLIQFYENRFFMVHNMDPDIQDQSKKREFLPIRISGTPFLNDLATEFEKAFTAEKMTYFLANENTIKQLDLKRNQWHSKKIAIEKTSLDSLKENSNSIENYKYHHLRLAKIFDREYRKIKNSPLIKKDNHPANIFFFIKAFSQTSYRFHKKNHHPEGNYPYSIRLVISESQKSDLKLAFNNLKDRYYKDSTLGEDNNFDDKFFWELLQEDDGIDNILDVLESPYELEERSMSDAVFSTGYVNIKEMPFKFNGNNRLEEPYLQNKDSFGYKRLVCFHYMLMLLSQNEDFKNNQNPRILLVPGHVGGNPFFCIGHVYSDPEEQPNGKKLKNAEEHKHHQWLNNYHFYYSICHYLIRGARNKIGNLYLEEIHKTYIEKQKNIINSIATQQSFSPREFCDILNPAFKSLSRVYSYAYLKFSPIDNNEIINLNDNQFSYRYLSQDIYFMVSLESNIYFDAHIEGIFFDKGRFKECIEKADEELRRQLINIIRKANTHKPAN